MQKVIFLLFALAAIFAVSVADDDDFDGYPCASDAVCGGRRCCLDSGFGGKFCKEMPDDFGEICGGPYACPTCREGRTCEPISPGGVVNRATPGRCGRSQGLWRNWFDDDDD